MAAYWNIEIPSGLDTLCWKIIQPPGIDPAIARYLPPDEAKRYVEEQNAHRIDWELLSDNSTFLDSLEDQDDLSVEATAERYAAYGNACDAFRAYRWYFREEKKGPYRHHIAPVKKAVEHYRATGENIALRHIHDNTVHGAVFEEILAHLEAEERMRLAATSINIEPYLIRDVAGVVSTYM